MVRKKGETYLMVSYIGHIWDDLSSQACLVCSARQQSQMNPSHPYSSGVLQIK